MIDPGDHCRELDGEEARLLVFDSNLTTTAVLNQVNRRGIRFPG